MVCTPPALLLLPPVSYWRETPKNPSYSIGPVELLFHLVFFSTFEDLNLPIHGPVEDARVLKLYKPSPIPCLYVAPVANMVGRVPLLPLYLAGNTTPTIPHKFSKHKGSGFPMGCTNTAAVDGRRGTNVYEAIRTWQATPGWSDSEGDCPEEGR